MQGPPFIPDAELNRRPLSTSSNPGQVVGSEKNIFTLILCFIFICTWY